jgi:arylsulfatase A-like enzyme
MLTLPPGGIIEYYVDLPMNPALKFGLLSDMEIAGNSKVNVCIYSEGGEKIIHSFTGEELHQPKENIIELKKFAMETVRIVFSNSKRNHKDLNVSWLNPVIISSSTKYLPSFWESRSKENVGISGVGEVKRSRKANVFIYLVDALRADHLSCYGYEKKTSPFLDKFSKDSILFKKCFANASWTRPAVASILTGLYPNKHRAESRKEKLSSDAIMISEVLQSKGFSTHYITANSNVSKAFNFKQGIDNYLYLAKRQENKKDRYFSSEFINENFFKSISESADFAEKPIFAYLHTVDPHEPYTPQDPFLKFKRQDLEKGREHLANAANLYKKRGTSGLTEKDLAYVTSLYDCEILHNDYYFGEFIEFLKDKDLYDNSIIVFLADHGEQFMEHRGLTHGNSIYNEEIHVPLVIKFPGGEYADQQSELYVSQVDIVPTILDYLGMDIPPKVDGENVLPFLDEVGFKRTILIKELKVAGKNFVGFISSADKKKYIARYKGKEFKDMVRYEVYNLRRDFGESDNLFRSRSQFHFQSMKFQIDYLLELIGRSAFRKEKEVDYKKLDPKILEELRGLGYIK